MSSAETHEHHLTDALADARARLISQERITACTRCNRDKAAVARHAPDTYGAQCRHNPLGEHDWWTGTLQEWYNR
jgi:hypothetical protein